VIAGLVLAGTAGSAVTSRIQHRAAQGVAVDVYSSGLAVFDLRRTEPKARSLLTGPSGLTYGCLHARFARGVWRTGEYALSGRFARRLRFRWRGVVGPYDGCELGGLYGHRWWDQWGTRNAVEIWLTVRGRHFFNDRAAARDLAYFVRAGRAQRIRLSANPRAGLERFMRRYSGRVVELASPSGKAPRHTIGFWIGESRLVFTVTSSTKRRFFVVATRGTLKLPVKNLGDLAFVF
jgi:hypothetical protein